MSGDETRGEAEAPTDVARLADAEGAGVEALIAQEWALHLVVCTERSCGTRVRYSELTDDANTHWHVKPGLAMFSLARRDAARDRARDAEVRRGVEAVREVADTMWRTTTCGCGHRADLHLMGDKSGCVAGLTICPCNRSLDSIVADRLRAALKPLAEIEEGSP